jgi:hypothetical protein
MRTRYIGLLVMMCVCVPLVLSQVAWVHSSTPLIDDVVVIMTKVAGGAEAQPLLDQLAAKYCPCPTGTPTGATAGASGAYKVGDIVRVGDALLTVTKVQRSGGVQYSKPATGKQYAIVYLHVENAGESGVSVAPYDFKVKDSNGVISSMAFVFGLDNQMGMVELAPGGKLDGTVPFEVPQNDKGLQLVYQPNIFSDEGRVFIDLR